MSSEMFTFISKISHNFSARWLQFLYVTAWRSPQSTRKGLHFGASSVTTAYSDQKIWSIFMFPTSSQLSKLCNSQTNGGVTTSLELAVFVISSNASLNFIANCIVAIQLLKVPSSRSCLALTYCKVISPQCNRYTVGVESHLNYLELNMVLLQALVCAVGQVQKRTSRVVTMLILKCSLKLPYVTHSSMQVCVLDLL